MGKILIKTYPHESGLLYLGISLYLHLKSQGHEVKLIPKSKYIKKAGRFVSHFPEPHPEVKDLFINFANGFDANKQVVDVVKKFGADTVISLETLMQDSRWVSSLRGRGVKIIDVPMIEWVSPQYLNRGSYKIFDEVWAVTDNGREIFEAAGYNNVKAMSWDYVDKSLFYPDKTIEKEGYSFYHQASLNPEYTSKNTELVVHAFSRLTKEYGDSISLHLTGKIHGLGIDNLIEKHANIHVYNRVLNRAEIADLYRKVDCVVAPSSREGLGLSLYEAEACGCKIVTTDAPPMNQHNTKYLCEVSGFKKDRSLVPIARLTVDSVYKQMKKVCEDEMSETVTIKETKQGEKAKSEEEISEENGGLMAAFSEPEPEPVKEERKVDPDKLAALKAKIAEKQKTQEGVVPEVIAQREVSINIGVVGVGQAGSRIAEEFHRLGYDVGVVNTSAQDLKFIGVAPHQKLLLEGTLGGTGKDLDLGREIFSTSIEDVASFVEGVAEGNDMLFLAVSGGGGTGSSSVDTMVPLLFNLEMPVGVIYVLPKATEDPQSKSNSVETLARLAKMTAQDMISSLVVVDNARIEQIYGGLSQSQFWSTANSAIVEPINLFNTLTSQPSKFTSLDPSDFGKIISCGDCSVYGVVEVEDYLEETALAEAVMTSLSSNMLAEGFDLTQTRTGGVIIVGSEEALSQIPAINIDYCFSMISSETNGASIFQGIYSRDDMAGDTVKIYSWFAGLGLPQDRIENLKKESKEQASVLAEKERMRTSSMTLDLEEDKVTSVKDEIERKIRKKKSGFNKLQGGGKSARRSIIDKRRR